MHKRVLLPWALCLFVLVQCAKEKSDESAETAENEVRAEEKYHGFSSQVKWGEHLVTIAACNDCHTPKKMTPMGPDLDTALRLSGHPANAPLIDIDRIGIEKKGLAVTGDLTEWVGPWGVSFTANLTPDPTGIGTWTEDQFMVAIREGKSKGLPAARGLLPPMPWQMYRHMTDEELRAIFAYLKSIKPISNSVPPPIPPASAGTLKN